MSQYFTWTEFPNCAGSCPHRRPRSPTTPHVLCVVEAVVYCVVHYKHSIEIPSPPHGDVGLIEIGGGGGWQIQTNIRVGLLSNASAVSLDNKRATERR